MTSIAALIPRFRVHRTGRVLAIRCTQCRIWRKPNVFNPHTNTCHDCVLSAARRRVIALGARRR
jgi:hypothetical protein